MNWIIYRYPTHFSISHSFLDKYIIGLLQGVLRRGSLNGPTAGDNSGNCGAGGTLHQMTPDVFPDSVSLYSHSTIS